MITSTQNAKIKHLVELQTKSKVRNKEGLLIAEGLRIFEEAPIKLIKDIYVEEGTLAEMQNEGLAPSSHLKKVYDKICACKEKGCFVETVTMEVMKKASDTSSPQGIIFVCRKPNFELKDILGNFPEKSKGNVLILEDIQDPGNLGTMMRTAEAAGMSGIIMSRQCADMYNPKTVRSTMGAIFRVPHVYVDSLTDTINELKESKIKIYATDLKADGAYDEVDYSGRCGILIGNEGNGLSRELVEISDTRVIIPMCGEIESLNAAVAAALMMYISR